MFRAQHRERCLKRGDLFDQGIRDARRFDRWPGDDALDGGGLRGWRRSPRHGRRAGLAARLRPPKRAEQRREAAASFAAPWRHDPGTGRVGVARRPARDPVFHPQFGIPSSPQPDVLSDRRRRATPRADRSIRADGVTGRACDGPFARADVLTIPALKRALSVAPVPDAVRLLVITAAGLRGRPGERSIALQHHVPHCRNPWSQRDRWRAPRSRAFAAPLRWRCVYPARFTDLLGLNVPFRSLRMKNDVVSRPATKVSQSGSRVVCRAGVCRVRLLGIRAWR